MLPWTMRRLASDHQDVFLFRREQRRRAERKQRSSGLKNSTFHIDRWNDSYVTKQGLLTNDDLTIFRFSHLSHVACFGNHIGIFGHAADGFFIQMPAVPDQIFGSIFVHKLTGIFC